MNKHSRLWSVISYITWVGWVVALFARDKDDRLVRRHLNQALIINLVETAGRLIGRLGGIFRIVSTVIDLIALVFFFLGVIRAFKMSDEPLPVIGEYELIK